MLVIILTDNSLLLNHQVLSRYFLLEKKCGEVMISTMRPGG